MEVPDNIVEALRHIMQCSGPFDDLDDLQQLWRAAFPGDVVYCGNYDCVDNAHPHAGACQTPTHNFYVNQRVYYRRGDLFGTIRELDSTSALVKFEWPYDPAAEPERRELNQLQPAYEVE